MVQALQVRQVRRKIPASVRPSAALILPLAFLAMLAWLAGAVAPVRAAEGAAIAYAPALEGEIPDAIIPLLEQSARAFQWADRPPSGLLMLRQRANDDRREMTRVLNGLGYYGARVAVRLERPEGEPVRVVFAVETGPVYHFDRVEVATPPGVEAPPGLPTSTALGLAPGEPALAQKVLDAEAALTAAVQERGYARAETGPRDAVVDHLARTLSVTLMLQPGPLIRLGGFGVEGGEDVAAELIKARVRWRPGDLYQPEALEATRQALLSLGLFQSVRLTLAEEADGEGLWPVTIVLADGPRRSLSGGLGYSSGQGLTLQGRWEHRNLLGAAQHLQTDWELFSRGRRLSLDLDIPDPERPNRTIRLENSFESERTPAFSQSALNLGAGINRPGWWAGDLTYGVAWRAIDLKDATTGETGGFGLLSFPVQMQFDRSNDPLDPRHGWRAAAGVAPHAELFGADMLFTRFLSSISGYATPEALLDTTFAAKAALDWTWDPLDRGAPAAARLFAGGGGSIRGYNHQTAGDLDDDFAPLGGLSRLELSGETRIRYSSELGMALFVDGGRSFLPAFPTRDQSLFWAAGAGFRYTTPIGPLRFDLALPLNRRPSDDSFQIYIGIGQAF